MTKNFNNVSISVADERSNVMDRIKALKERISKARDMFLADKIDEDDFRDIKNRYKKELEELEEKFLIMKSDPENEIEKKLGLALTLLQILLIAIKAQVL